MTRIILIFICWTMYASEAPASEEQNDLLEIHFNVIVKDESDNPCQGQSRTLRLSYDEEKKTLWADNMQYCMTEPMLEMISLVFANSSGRRQILKSWAPVVSGGTRNKKVYPTPCILPKSNMLGWYSQIHQTAKSITKFKEDCSGFQLVGGKSFTKKILKSDNGSSEITFQDDHQAFYEKLLKFKAGLYVKALNEVYSSRNTGDLQFDLEMEDPFCTFSDTLCQNDSVFRSDYLSDFFEVVSEIVGVAIDTKRIDNKKAVLSLLQQYGISVVSEGQNAVFKAGPYYKRYTFKTASPSDSTPNPAGQQVPQTSL
ncbi:MAG: hypothetical protein ACPGXY_00595 [Alphaproteobacteria bacterium]